LSSDLLHVQDTLNLFVILLYLHLVFYFLPLIYGTFSLHYSIIVGLHTYYFVFATGLSSLNLPSATGNISEWTSEDAENIHRLAAMKTSVPVSEHQSATNFDGGVKQTQDEVDLMDMADRDTSQFNKQQNQRREKQDDTTNVNLINQLMTLLEETGSRFDFNDNDLDNAIPFIGLDGAVPDADYSQSSLRPTVGSAIGNVHVK